MTKQLAYKGYSATVEFDAEDRLFYARLNGIADIVPFHGESAAELVEAFEEVLVQAANRPGPVVAATR